MLLGGVTRRTSRLADGRDLMYYYDAESRPAGELAIDSRSLEPRAGTPELRQDPLSGEWISVAPARQHRAHLPADDPLAPGGEIASDYDVAVFENRSPSFGPAIAAEDLGGLGLGRTVAATGRCEVISFSASPEGSLGGMPPARVRTVIEAWADRTAELSRLPGVAQVFVFENRGEQIGATLPHPHGQLYAYPYLTPRTERLLAAIEQQGAGLFERILEFERASERLVLAGEHWSAFVPFAARWPIEVHVLPHRHVPDLNATNDAERAELSVLLPRLLRGIDALYESPTPYIAAWHQAPVSVRREEVRLMLQLTSPRRAADKFKHPAASEASMGAWIADLVPEESAAILRDGIERA